MHPICFMIRNRPQNADIIDLVLRENRAFVGYAPIHKDKWNQDGNFKGAMFDISNPDNVAWKKFKQSWSGNLYSLRHASTYRNLVMNADIGSIIAVPRRTLKTVYLGEYQGFELVDNPPWRDDYIKLRQRQKQPIDDELDHVRDVVQSFKVNEWRPVDINNFSDPLERTMRTPRTTALFSAARLGESDYTKEALSPYIKLKRLFDEASNSHN